MKSDIKNMILPNQISLLVEAINDDNPEAARLLVRRAMAVTHGFKNDNVSKNELDAIIALIRGINPKDTAESILAAQYVALHLKAMAIIAQDNYNTIGQGMMMVRLSHQALNALQQYRGKCQTINVNYAVNSAGNAMLNTMIQVGDVSKNGG